MTLPTDPFAPVVALPRRRVDPEDLRMAWRDACADLRLAYLGWQEASASESPDAFAAYLAAADREATAAEAYSSLVTGAALAA